MTFQLYPAIDLRNGKCVRLFQGDFTKETVYSETPLEVAKAFVDQGAEWLHIVDLDGAKIGTPQNKQTIVQMLSELKVAVQIGGGIRSERDIEWYLENEASRLIIGSLAVRKPELIGEWVKTYGSSTFAVSLDAKDGYVATDGWLKNSRKKAVDVAKQLADIGVETFIFTDIATDGTLSGPNVQAIEQLAVATGCSVIASGGVSSIDDVRKLVALKEKGVQGAIIGKALYTGKLSLEEAYSLVNSYVS
ncbi:MAG: 1-(5-phosphoribosyl)-5-[(5-phosphoribosylamino)methylideneamino]imidazole-4-carboxamide isomerase [Bacillus sp. (in: Bacteria)]|jgi:phosphoribosylformimino-5-aminoimidazole carboxamide ribotide isomerase|nr:1-(5-phosphoribosyl)-5-[(5-phosphoribosylamino)methylideneamino]imidazole-4-carboxamide isomerase [Bacillus sp. (in: firmicutes)]